LCRDSIWLLLSNTQTTFEWTRENECLGKFSPASSHRQQLPTNFLRSLLCLKNLFDYYLIVFPSDDDENEHANKNLKAFQTTFKVMEKSKTPVFVNTRFFLACTRQKISTFTSD
jgi:hypothetical protein